MKATKKQLKLLEPFFTQVAAKPYEYIVISQIYEHGDMPAACLTPEEVILSGLKLLWMKISIKYFRGNTFRIFDKKRKV